MRDNVRKKKLTRIVDLGSGAGKTIIPIVEQLSSIQRQTLKITLVDVNKGDMRTARDGLIALGVPKKNISMIGVNFGSMNSSGKIRGLFGKADMVTRGGQHYITYQDQKQYLK